MGRLVRALLLAGGLIGMLATATTADPPGAAAAPKAVVVLLHAYDPVSDWTQDIGRGVLETLRSAHKEVDLREEFLDSRRHNGGEYFELTRALLVAKYSAEPLRVVIACDDAAVQFLLDRPTLFAGVPVVFGGVQSRELVDRLPRDRFTGVIEHYTLDQVVDDAIRARPMVRRIFVGTDNTANGTAFRSLIADVQRTHPQLTFVPLAGNVLAWPQILERLRTETTPADLVMSTPIIRDAAGATRPPDVTMSAIAQAAQAPVIGLTYDGLDDGLFAVTLNTGRTHGRRMAAKALQVMGGTDPSGIPIDVDRDSPLAFDARELARWGVSEAALGPGARVERRLPLSFYQTYRGWIWAGIGFSVLQSLIIGGLFLNVRRRRRAEAARGEQAQALSTANRALEEMNRSLLHEQDVRQQAEAELRHAQKMEAVGRLAGGVAHDFNNLLTVTIGYCELLLSRIGRGTPEREAVEQIRRASEQAATLTQNLLAFSRRQVAMPVIVDVPATIQSMSPMLRRFCGEGVTLTLALGQPVAVRLGQGQLEQILMNLVINGRDAMPEGGRLEVRVRTRTVETDGGSASGLPTTKRVEILVTDTGTGMDATTRLRIFEPFFTTKDVGHGTGLGLSTVYGIVTQHGGQIDVESAPGEGASFRISLPLVERGTTALPVESTATPEGPSATGVGASGPTVLVVDDEHELRHLVSRILRDEQFEVLEAACGREATAIAASHPGTIHLLLTDIVMPGDDGLTVARQVREIRPDIAVAYLSGYTDDGLVPDAPDLLLRKPFLPAALLAHVRAALAATETGVQR